MIIKFKGYANELSFTQSIIKEIPFSNDMDAVVAFNDYQDMSISELNESIYKNSSYVERTHNITKVSLFNDDELISEFTVEEVEK